jgi:hypothetical protein
LGEDVGRVEPERFRPQAEGHSHAIESRVSLVDSGMMIWAENQYVLFFIRAASAEPFDMVPFG